MGCFGWRSNHKNKKSNKDHQKAAAPARRLPNYSTNKAYRNHNKDGGMVILGATAASVAVISTTGFGGDGGGTCGGGGGCGGGGCGG
ncbi:hypothetical protein M5689_010061 [Euphorbia peplus]|nr:hypothetical protein M5689_010061 [Euphorbia peplus]